ncbi:RimK family alpha-L-glutamate ligase [Spirillospora sp. NPDC048911]|uniref:RimK family alpha-L-glutamate ligase n=1 Tax=Spirillospora sp. NPDC048911 TaxID=3364527 RepID=UPI0037221FEE
MRMATPSIAVLASRMRYEEKQIFAALERRNVAHVPVDPRELSLLGGARWAGPRLVINREIGHFRALYAAGALESAGATVVNRADTTRISGDKWHTTAALLNSGLPTPRTALAMTPEAALPTLEELGYPAVIKPLVGSWGRLVGRLPDAGVATTVLEHVAALPSPQSQLIYLQELVAKAARDLRVIVVGGEALGATWRRAADWRANVARGAVSERCPLATEHAELAVAAAAAVGADIAGVDLIEAADGELTVLEVNDRVEFRGFQEAHGQEVGVAEAIVSHALSKVPS